ncbi:MAG: hypothetical protein FWE67_10230 [Planctomycetaceae bacterium]|nr:hypothetical protein [Planctomycetaceae bacterium]
MRTKFFIALFVFMLLAAFSVAFAQQVSDSTPKRAKPTEFVIFPWGPMPSDPASGQWGDIADVNAMMKDLYDCGFNTSGFTHVQNLQHIRNNHLAGILFGLPVRETSQEKADKAVQKFLEPITDPEDRKAVFAVYLRDEPNAALFPTLNVWSEAVKKQGIMPYINLFPDYASAEQLGAKDYQEHLDKYVETCKPPYISYDNYSLFDNGTFDEDRFYGNMESVRKKSLEADIPFWNVILSNAHFHYAEPSDATLAVQVYSTLAYGGKGIGYFTYYTPQVGNYRLAPIDRFGYRTKTWEMMRNINLQVHSLSRFYCELKSVNVFHAGGKVPRNGQGIESAKFVESVGGGSLLFGEFVHPPDERPFVLVVNKSLKASSPIHVAFKGGGKVMMVSSFSGKIVPFTGEQRWLAPGCGVLLTVN